MFSQLATILHTLFQPGEETGGPSVFDPASQFDETRTDEPGIVQSLNAAFLIGLAGADHPAALRAKRFLDAMADSPEWATVAGFYRRGIELIRNELAAVGQREPDFADRLGGLAQWVATPDNLLAAEATQEKIWSVFFPEAVGIRHKEKQRIDSLRQRRHVRITQLNSRPISHPAREILFTSNVLLTLPSASTRPDQLGLGEQLTERLHRACDEPQLFWYDHPIQMGVEPEANEVLYGLGGLQSTFEFERDRGHVPRDARLTCVLSVSVTHQSLHGLARQYLVKELGRVGGFANLDVFVFTEKDTRRLVDEILAPAAEHYLQWADANDLLDVLGVDGHYGRHYSFLKAIAAFWNVFIDREKKATFKIDLDQVFPQPQLVEQSGGSAFEHFTTPLWGARGVDAGGRPLELGMIAGAAVNERDIVRGLFTPDVPFPTRVPAMDECVFFSRLPQALSTEAEMMTRYDTGILDGRAGCLRRIHVTGGMSGILVDSLRRHRPFAPSFIGRAEDQAYLLSAMFGRGERLACVHQPGLIMRHDKEAFAQQAIATAHVGQLIGDYERILYFSAYAGALADDASVVKDAIDPFTGCFVSAIPATLVHLRFALKCAALFAEGKPDQALQFVALGARRIADALDFTQGAESHLKGQCAKQRRGWDLYYDVLAAVETALKNKDTFAATLHRRAGELVAECRLADES